jgi:cytochrome P450
MSQKQCEAEILTALVAGSDTTANSLRMGLLLLATTPHVHRRLQKEIDEAIANGSISSPITVAEAKALPYLQAFIWESLRYHPPVALLFPKVVPTGGDTLDGKFVPGGTKIAFDSWSFGRRTDVFGDDAGIFRPERFLDASAENRVEMEKTTELLFGFGRYMCAGKVFAFMELNKVFVEVRQLNLTFEYDHENPNANMI